MTCPITIQEARNAASLLNNFISVHARRKMLIEDKQIQELAPKLFEMLEQAILEEYLSRMPKREK